MPKYRNNRLQRETDIDSAIKRERKRAARKEQQKICNNTADSNDESADDSIHNESSNEDIDMPSDSSDNDTDNAITNEDDNGNDRKNTPRMHARAKKSSHKRKSQQSKKHKTTHGGKTDEAKAREKIQRAERKEERKERWKNRKRIKDLWHEYKDQLAEKHASSDWKPLSAKVFDKFFPARADMPYTHEQNRHHAMIVRTFAVIIVCILGFCGWRIYDFYSYKTSSELIIPSTTYTPAQKETVKSDIEKQGFQNITQDDEGTHAYGTPKMVQAYKDSYKEKVVDPAIEKLNKVKDNSDVKNLDSIYVSKDYKSISINTGLFVATSTDFNKILTYSSEIEKAINSVVSWNIMNGTPKTHFSFWHVIATNDNANENNNASNIGIDSKEFYSCEATSCSDIISQLEKKEHDEADKNKNNSNENNSNDNSNNTSTNSNESDTNTDTSK